MKKVYKLKSDEVVCGRCDCVVKKKDIVKIVEYEPTSFQFHPERKYVGVCKECVREDDEVWKGGK